MSKSVFTSIRVWKAQTRNWRVISIRSLFNRFFENLTIGYQNIYITLLGADPVQLGFVNSFSNISGGLISAPLGWLQDKFGLVKVIELTGYVTSVMIDTSSYESILRGLAERWHTSIPMGRQGKGPADLYINDLLHVCGEFKSDTVICFGHAGCRYMKGLQGLVREACRDYGIPYFYVDIDALDPRFTPKETVRAQIDDFLTNVVLQLR